MNTTTVPHSQQPPTTNVVAPHNLNSPRGRANVNDTDKRAQQQQQQKPTIRAHEIAQIPPYKPQIPRLIGKRFLVGAKLGSGSFGTIHAGKIISNNQEVAIKFEEVKSKFPQLLAESKIYKILWGLPIANSKKTLLSLPGQNEPNQATALSKSQDSITQLSQHSQNTSQEIIGIPKLFWYGVEEEFNVMVIECLGPSLEDLFSFCSRRFSLKTVLILADQLISRIQFLHEKNFVHRDVKPENFLMGRKEKAHHVYMVDYGLAKKYMIEEKGEGLKHIPMRKNKSLTGTARYTSTNSHLGYEQGRRDDLESIGYLFVYFLNGSLPWQGLMANNRQKKYEKIAEKKMNISVNQLCAGLPIEFTQYFLYVKKLKFDERPDYDYLRTKFANLFNRMGYKMDFEMDWMKLRKDLGQAQY